MTSPAVPAVPGITAERLAEIEALAAAASPGPWAVTSWDLKGVMPLLWAADALPTDQRGPFAHISANDSRDAAFIAAARTVVPELLVEVRRLNGQVEQVAAETRESIAQEFDRLAGNRNPHDVEGSRRESDFATHAAVRIRRPDLFSGVIKASEVGRG